MEKERLYRVLYDEAKFSMQEAEVKIENLQVTGECIGMATDTEDMRSSANAPQTEKMETDGVSEELLKTIGKLIIPVVIISLGDICLCGRKSNHIHRRQKMSEREKVDTYTIPPNFAESGKWFSGRVSAGM